MRRRRRSSAKDPRLTDAACRLLMINLRDLHARGAGWKEITMAIAQHLKTSHALLDGVMLSGAFTGAVLGGVISGPTAAIGGAVVGAVVGFVAGAGLERASTRADAH